MFAPQRSTHPFRIIENDTISIQSMTSLGRVGRILAGTIDVANSVADTQSSNAATIDSSSVAGMSNSAMSTASEPNEPKSNDRNSKSSTTSYSNAINNSNSNSNNSNISKESSSSDAITLQGNDSTEYSSHFFRLLIL